MHQSRILLGRIPAVALLAIGVSAIVAASQLQLGTAQTPGPGLWPMVIAVVISVLSLCLIVAPSAHDNEAWDRRSVRVTFGISVLVVFVLLFHSVGLLLSSLFVIFVWLKLMAGESTRFSAVSALAGSVAVYVIFAELLRVPFPPDLVLSALGLEG